MIKKIIIKGLLCITCVFMLGTNESYASSQGVITTSTLNVRSGPSTSNKVIGSVKKNNSVTILNSQNGWYKIKYSNKEGWVSGKYVKQNQVSNNNDNNNNSNTTTNNNSSHGVVTTSTLNIRSGPSTSNKVIGSVKKNNSVTILNSQNGWYKIKYSNKEGWVSAKYIKQSSQTNNSSNNTSSSTNQVKQTLNVVATAYTGYSTTSTGQKPVWGTIAVDPKVIPYGTKVYIPKFDKVFVANNTGGAIKGNKIDIYMNSKKECYDWGRKTIEIQILK